MERRVARTARLEHLKREDSLRGGAFSLLAVSGSVLVEFGEKLERRGRAHPAQRRVPLRGPLLRLEGRRQRAWVKVEHCRDELGSNEPDDARLDQLGGVLTGLAQQLLLGEGHRRATRLHTLLHNTGRLPIHPHLLGADLELAKVALHGAWQPFDRGAEVEVAHVCRRTAGQQQHERRVLHHAPRDRWRTTSRSSWFRDASMLRGLFLLVALAPHADALSVPSRAASRRQACRAAAALGSSALLGPLAAFADEPKMPPISASKMLTIGQYLSDVKESRLFVKSTLAPMATSDCEQLRRELRKPPLRESEPSGFKLPPPLPERNPRLETHARARAR